jgi:glycosyltransferase involved in cell wall biosynthesis
VFAGRIDDEWERVNIVRASDIALLPSYGEALPMALIEASASGRPVVATDVGGVREVISDGTSGTLIPPGEITAIGEALIDLLQDHDRQARMGQAGRVLVQERFDMYSWARRLANVYAEAMGGSQAKELGTASFPETISSKRLAANAHNDVQGD